jgi:iron only hydrogenase large subunit-like protein
LDDCLACSGCVTSAESVLINQQSVDELYKVIHNNIKYKSEQKENLVKVICISISPQTRASLANKYNIDIEKCTKKLCGLFKHHLSASYVFDTTFSRQFSIQESQKEFVRNFQKSEEFKLPILTSVCPGWICYAEKTHGSFILPHISRVKSPQQVMGSLIKDFLAQIMEFTPEQYFIYQLCRVLTKNLKHLEKISTMKNIKQEMLTVF